MNKNDKQLIFNYFLHVRITLDTVLSGNRTTKEKKELLEKLYTLTDNAVNEFKDFN